MVEPVIGDGTTDVNGNPIDDVPRREQLAELGTLLSNFEAWPAARGYLSTPYDPGCVYGRDRRVVSWCGR